METKRHFPCLTKDCEMSDVDCFEVRGTSWEDKSGVLVERLERGTLTSLGALEYPAQVAEIGSLRSELTILNVVRHLAIVKEDTARLFRFVD